jgi:elongation factor P--beta-lysine ligase
MSTMSEWEERYARDEQDRREYVALAKRVEEATSADLTTVARAAYRYLRTLPNPVYSEALRHLLSRRALQVLSTLDFDNERVYSVLKVQQISKAVLAADYGAQGILEDNAESQG